MLMCLFLTEKFSAFRISLDIYRLDHRIEHEVKKYGINPPIEEKIRSTSIT